MKVNKTFLTIGIVATLLGACKKEEVEEVINLIPVPAEVNKCVAQVNTTAFEALNFSSNSTPSTFQVMFTNSTGGITKKITLGSNYKINIAAGTYSLNNNSTDSTSLVAYYSLDTTNYAAISGTINIAELNVNTDSADVRRFVATFNFNTDTIAGNHYNVNGSASYFNN